MRKRKDGKVIASLTEVKNKTGDIFALVDQYGEVTLTSYNKEKYKIVKIDLSDMLDHEEQDAPKVVPVAKKEEVVVEEPAEEIVEEVEEDIVEEKVEVEAVVPTPPIQEAISVPSNIVEKVETKTEIKEEKVDEVETQAPSGDEDMTDIIPWEENSEVEQMHVQEITAALQ